MTQATASATSIGPLLKKDDHLPAERFQQLRRGDRCRGPKVVVEGIRPQHDAALAGRISHVPAVPARERLIRETRHPALRRNAANPLHGCRKAGRLR